MSVINDIFKGMEYGVYVDFNTKALKIEDETWDIFVINSTQQFHPYINHISNLTDSTFYNNIHSCGISTIIHYLSLENQSNNEEFLKFYFRSLKEAIDYKNVFILISVTKSVETKRLLEDNSYEFLCEENEVEYYIHSFFSFLKDYE